MAPEILASSDRQPSADVFSLGLTLYEICLPPLGSLCPSGSNGISCNTSSSSSSCSSAADNSGGAVGLGLGADVRGIPYPMRSRPLPPLGLVAGSVLPSEGDLWHKLREGQAAPLEGRPSRLRSAISSAMSPEPHDRPTPAQFLLLPEVVAAGAGVDPTLAAATPHLPPQPLNRTASFVPLLEDGLKDELSSAAVDSNYYGFGNVAGSGGGAASGSLDAQMHMGFRVSTPTGDWTNSWVLRQQLVQAVHHSNSRDKETASPILDTTAS